MCVAAIDSVGHDNGTIRSQQRVSSVFNTSGDPLHRRKRFGNSLAAKDIQQDTGRWHKYWLLRKPLLEFIERCGIVRPSQTVVVVSDALQNLRAHLREFF